jgi:LysM repeat protein
MKKIFILLFGFLVVTYFAIIHVSASEEYIIKKGDTLWDISGDMLQDNFLWPKIWKANPQIKNPDLIYPGDRITIPTEEELRPLGLPVVRQKPVVKKTPPAHKPETKITEEKPVKYIVDKSLYIASGWISDDFPSIGQITSSPSDSIIFGNYDTVYLTLDRDTIRGERFLIIRDIKKVKHPETGKNLGHQIRATGILEVIDIKDDTTVAEIIDVFEEIQTGDGLLPYEDMQPPIMPEALRTPDIDGYIVESRMNNMAITMGDIIYIDKGMNDGLEVGDVFNVFSSTPIKTTVGLIQVVSLKASTSTAIVLKSKREIGIGDMWGKK